ncbi:hypothetical protein EC957_008986 [Mortierella hygrophila]|uniref:Uncharacterized protein n=1 Tax=Mortierella hygrophila TaxID=979708 RepID=A0A9P6FC24_9FUNG|nr:hypothetical protein EC957_008986 [Mortierella hygrophila]
MKKSKKSRVWRTAIESIPGSEYLLSEEEPRKFDHVAFLSFLNPSSHERRDITNTWLQKVVPSLKSSTRQDLQEAGSRLEREWKSKAVKREAFWTDLTETEKQRKEEKERLEYLKSAGEKRLRTAEGYLVEKMQHDFGKAGYREVAKLRAGDESRPPLVKTTHRSGGRLKEVSPQQGTSSQATSSHTTFTTSAPLSPVLSSGLTTDSRRRTSNVTSSTEESEDISAPEKSSTNTMLGKRGRTHRDEIDDNDRVKAVAGRSPFLSGDDASEPLEDDDPVREAQIVPNAPLNVVFDTEDYEFTAKLGMVDFGKEFRAYYGHCRLLSYDSDNLSDFVALSGVLFLEDRPTSLQKAYFGPKYRQLLELIDLRIDYPTADEVADAMQLCRNAKDLRQLSHPDLAVRYHEAIDIGVGKVSLSASNSKDQDDLARTLLWSKRAADEIVTRFEETEDMNLLFVQVIGQTCNLYVMCRAGRVCVATKIGTVHILYTLSDALSFEDQVQAWMILDKTFNSTVSVLNDATYRQSDLTPPPCFPVLATPRSLKMKAGANRGRV